MHCESSLTQGQRSTNKINPRKAGKARVKWDGIAFMGKGKQATRYSSVGSSRDGAKAKKGTQTAETEEKAQEVNETATHEASEEGDVEMAYWAKHINLPINLPK